MEDKFLTNVTTGFNSSEVEFLTFPTVPLNTNVTENNISTFTPTDEYIFDRTDVRVIFISLYTIVFCCCFFGNLLVILVVTLSRRLRSITNFFLANLAVADFCVGIFCVFQNLSMYLIPTWVLGDFLCKMYQFVHSLSYTASIFILIVICTERYFAIIHPITCKQILTPKRLRLVIVGVWLTSAAYSAPRFLWVQTIENHMHDGRTETICATHRKKYNSKIFDIINFALLYCLPLAIMTILYTRIAVGLWRSSRQLEKHLNASMSGSSAPQPPPQSYASCHDNNDKIKEQNMNKLQRQSTVRFNKNSKKFATETNNTDVTILQHQQQAKSSSSQNVLRARRGVIRMLIVVVLTFAICNLPFHARKMWQYWSSGYSGSSDFSTLFTPLTFLITYFNSGINPLLYAFLSRNFRRGMREILLCSFNDSPGQTQAHKLYTLTKSNEHNRLALLQRQASTRSTLKTTVTNVNIGNSDDYSHEL